MRTIILPGYSPGNKDWAYDIQRKLQIDQVILVHEWGHWKEGGSFSLPREAQEIIDEIEGDKVNIIAKSVGTRITMHLIPKMVNQIEKVILCGIPTKFQSYKPKELYTKGIKLLSPNDVLVIQNTNDPFSNFLTVNEVVKEINPKIKVIEGNVSGHNYPYIEEFQKFLEKKSG